MLEQPSWHSAIRRPWDGDFAMGLLQHKMQVRAHDGQFLALNPEPETLRKTFQLFFYFENSF